MIRSIAAKRAVTRIDSIVDVIAIATEAIDAERGAEKS